MSKQKVVKGYKVFNPDWTCRGFQYQVGKCYEIPEKPVVCKRGFHFCKIYWIVMSIIDLMKTIRWQK